MARAALTLNRLIQTIVKFSPVKSHFHTKSLNSFKNLFIHQSVCNKPQLIHPIFANFLIFQFKNGNFNQINVKSSVRCRVNTENENESQPSKQDKYIRLMEFPEIFWPTLLRHIENSLLLTLIMQLRFDQSFNEKKFLSQAKKMVLKVSKHLSKGELQQLEGLVTEEALKEIDRNLQRMSKMQRDQLKIKAENLYLGFIYTFDVKIVDDMRTKVERRFVEIICCFHSFSRLEELKKSHSSPEPFANLLLTNIFENSELVTICNYSFIREFTLGKSSQWQINRLNQFRPKDIPDPFDVLKFF